ncbi:MAG: class I SAM-dependent methyltransferase [Lachnospiraceae bacterium]|nr:class I SAM-dependent methyltransferase [Lachnospiraceae bacterium]
MGSLYENAEIYDLIENENRYNAYKKHWEKLFEGKKIGSMLDISIGSGSVTIPVMDLGVSLSGSDLSDEMLGKCSIKITDKGYTPDLKTADFRDLSCWGNQKFDVVASTGNSLAHVPNEDALRVLEQMDEHVADAGYIYIDTRNWDKILREKKRFYLYDPFFVNDDRVNLTQVWDYNSDGSMTFNLLYTFEKDQKIYRKEKFEEHYIPLNRELITDKLASLGYKDIKYYSFPSYIPFENIDDEDWYTILAIK